MTVRRILHRLFGHSNYEVPDLPPEELYEHLEQELGNAEKELDQIQRDLKPFTDLEDRLLYMADVVRRARWNEMHEDSENDC